MAPRAIETSVTTNMIATIDGVTPANTPQRSIPARHHGRRPTIEANLQVLVSTINVPTRDFHSAYVQLTSLGVQYQLPAGIVLDAHYWGNKGTHMPTQSNIKSNPRSVSGPWVAPDGHRGQPVIRIDRKRHTFRKDDLPETVAASISAVSRRHGDPPGVPDGRNVELQRRYRAGREADL